jgi:hypothetical protein
MSYHKNKISICTVCMNRLHQLKETLMRNMEDNISYGEIEFVLLDYNSQDGMETWAKENLMPFIETGKLAYYKTTDPQTWSPSHSKNIVFKIATGTILCNIWADYYAGKGFAEYTNAEFNRNGNIVLTPIDSHQTKTGFRPPPDSLGRVCVNKTDFLKVGGFDERMDRHGFEDYDFINRLELAGIERVIIDNFSYLGFVEHPDIERYNLAEPHSLDIFLNYISPWKSECVILYQNQEIEKAIFVNESTLDAENYEYGYKPRNYRFEHTLENNSNWKSGNWLRIGKQRMVFNIEMEEKTIYLERIQQNKKVLIATNSNKTFYQVTDKEIIKWIMVFKHFYATRRLMEDNLNKKLIHPNPPDFGTAIIYKNFDLNPIEI